MEILIPGLRYKTTFFVYDFKHSREHRVRLVFNGSRQTPATYSDTFAPTVRAASIRLFHLYCVKMGYDIRQYDVPQAFLQSPMDHLIFVRPPQGYAAYPGEILVLWLGLYGAKQSECSDLGQDIRHCIPFW